MKNFLIVLCLLLSTTASAAMPTIMVFGDSISSGYGLPPETGWVSLLQKRLQTPTSASPAYQVINASISGETALGGRNRIKQALDKSGAPLSSTLEPMAQTVQCAEHGSQEAPYVCCHLVNSLRDLKKVGFFYASEPRGDAGCAACEAVRINEGGKTGDWNECSEEHANVKLLCGACYDTLPPRHSGKR